MFAEVIYNINVTYYVMSHATYYAI